MQTLTPACALMACALSFGSAVVAQPSLHATQVVASETHGGAGGGIFAPTNALGAPSGGGAGAGSTHVHSLGVGGSLTLGFDVVITDGPGADFLVAENPFFQGGTNFQSFAEVAYVEVSSDGIHFARFPSAYYGPATDPGPFGSVIVGGYENLAGSTPAYPTPLVQDAVAAGGDAFDLSDLVNHGLVSAGLVDLGAIHEVRIVDVEGGVDVDSRGVVIRDSGFGSADIDAVTVIHHTGNVDPNGPRIDVEIPADGQFSITIEDPNGLLDLISLQLSIYGLSVPPGDILAALSPTHLDPTKVSLAVTAPLPADLRFQLGVSVIDAGGRYSSDVRSRPDGL